MSTPLWFYSFANDCPVVNDILDTLRQCRFHLSGPEARRAGEMGLVILDGRNSDSAIEYIRMAKGAGASRMLAVIVPPVTAHRGPGWELLAAGASDVIVIGEEKENVEKIGRRFCRWREIEATLGSDVVKNKLIGNSDAWLAVLRHVVEIARYTDSAVLVTGESGTGKELIARLIHSLDSRRNKGGIVVLDCTTIVPELSGSEFFGHERGAFTGAVASRDGAFALAHGGTLFLDEVGELPPQLQSQLLRVVQEKTFKRVGGNTWHSTDFRLVCATNRDLRKEVEKGQFRSDLFYRIARCLCTLPPLRERREDILPLARHFISELAKPGKPREPDAPVRQYLTSRDYPGNVRDLKQLIYRMMTRYVGAGTISVGDVPEAERPPSGEEPGGPFPDGTLRDAVRRLLQQDLGLRDIRNLVENAAIGLAMDEEGGNLQRAAKRLGVTDRALQMRRAADRQRRNGNNGSDPPEDAGAPWMGAGPDDPGDVRRT